MAGPLMYDRVRETSTSTGTGTITLAGAVSGYQAFSAVGNGNTCYYAIVHRTTAEWEVGVGTYTSSGTTLARTEVISSSNSGSAVNFSSGTKDVFVTVPAGLVYPFPAIIPGGRFYADGVISSLYYNYYIHNQIQLWNSYRWKTIEFEPTEYALSGLDTSVPYDIFGYLSSGELAIEIVAWYSTTMRKAGLDPGITLQDGRYCKETDKTRLFLGTFMPLTSSSTVNSTTKRFIWNNYHRVLSHMEVKETANSWGYTSNTWRPYNNSTANRVELVQGLAYDAVTAFFQARTDGNGAVAIALDSTTTPTGIFSRVTGSYAGSVQGRYSSNLLGYHYLQAMERGAAGVTFYGDNNSDAEQAGIQCECWA